MTPELQKSEADNCDAQSGLSPAPLLGCSPTLCACGCGQPVTPDDRGRSRLYLRNHHFKGKTQSPKWVAKKVAGMKRAWADPSKLQTMRHQSPELVEKRAAAMRGRKLTPERVAEIKSDLKNAWKAGKFSGLTGASAEQMAKIIKMRDMPKLCAENSVRLTAKMKEWKESGRLDEIRRKAGNAKGMPDHIAAKHWTIRDPNGLTHEFSNLGEWARRHEHLFEDCAPASKLPHWLRISGGIGDLLNAKGRSCSYRGWVAVSKTELEEGAPDPLARDKQPNSPVAKSECRRDTGGYA